MKLAGVDLAWQSENNPSAIAIGSLNENVLSLDRIEPAVYGIDVVLERLETTNGLVGLAIDAPLVINNSSGQRGCEKAIGQTYSARHAACHTSNTTLYPDAASVYLAKQLQGVGFEHLDGDKWQIECYPHPAIIEIFGLKERLKYKKGRVAEKKEGQKVLAILLNELRESERLTLNIGITAQKHLDISYIESLSGQALKSNEDALDAVVCLYIAGLYAIDFQGQVFGDKHSGYIWVPDEVCIDLKRAANNPEIKGLELVDGLLLQVDTSEPKRVANGGIKKAFPRTTMQGDHVSRAKVTSSEFSKECPACGNHTFKSWPFGWDAHASHRCTGLESIGADARKAEFRSRFASLFK